nr:cell division protein FtsH [Erysipelotrichaceae bacterium]
LDEGIDRTIGGPAKKSRKYSDREKHMVAVHESGHAVIGLFLEDADEVQKVTIIPRGLAGGYNLMTPKEDTMLSTKSQLESQIVGLLGGRVAEEMVLNEISTGASNDIERATEIAKGMVSAYGMSSIGPIQYSKQDGNVFLGRDYTTNKTYSDQVAFEIDQEVRKIINESYLKAQQIIGDHRDTLDNIVKALEEQETLTKEDLENIVKYGTVKAPAEKTED